MHILDPDLIAESNLSRGVLFRPGAVGHAKASVAAAACPACSPPLPVACLSSGPDRRDLPRGWATGALSEVLLAEPLVLGGVCTGCGRRWRGWVEADERAAARRHCGGCGRDSLRLDLRDQLAPAELAALPRAARWGVKYASFVRADGNVLLKFS